MIIVCAGGADDVTKEPKDDVVDVFSDVKDEAMELVEEVKGV